MPSFSKPASAPTPIPIILNPSPSGPLIKTVLGDREGDLEYSVDSCRLDVDTATRLVLNDALRDAGETDVAKESGDH
ncbi:uncharacterized protein GBIM_09581 [Gryllus bimaculatus]|nr:uncharacterized protein GBIM_09581 [Gryllus bimaculatus]